MVRRRPCAAADDASHRRENHEARGPSFETPRKCAAPQDEDSNRRLQRDLFRREPPAGARSMRFSNRTSFQSSGLRVNSKPDLRASAIMASLERKVSPNIRVEPNA